MMMMMMIQVAIITVVDLALTRRIYSFSVTDRVRMLLFCVLFAPRLLLQYTSTLGY